MIILKHGVKCNLLMPRLSMIQLALDCGGGVAATVFEGLDKYLNYGFVLPLNI